MEEVQNQGDVDYVLYTDEDAESTASLDESLLEFPVRDGRRYHPFEREKYMLPNDEREQDRLDDMGEVWLDILGVRALSLKRPMNLRRVLDIGTGTGAWAIDFAEEHPEALVTGVDLSAIQPTWVPPNVKFEIADFDQRWFFPTGTFDFIFCRDIISIRNVKRFIKEAKRCLRSGGRCEFQLLLYDPVYEDGKTDRRDPLSEWSQCLFKAAESIGRPITTPESLIEALQSAGFQDIERVNGSIPCNSWPTDRILRERGERVMAALDEGLEGISLQYLRRLEWTLAEIMVFLSIVRKDLRNTKRHRSWPYSVISARNVEPEV